MAKVILGVTMSLDGFINDRDGKVDSLYPDLDELRNTETLQEAIKNTGAVVMGRRAYAMGDPDEYVGNYEFQVPIFVLTHHVPQKLPKQDDKLTFTFVSDGIESTIVQAKAAAGDKDVQVIGGANTAQQLINAELADELQISIMPVLLGDGLRFFEHVDPKQMKLEKIKVVESAARTDIWFRVVPVATSAART
ncbi:MAG: dihydrofolate reductase family protein [Chloroflexota bacterium]|nr:dihydrofolate reductase family protein [Chloroflexota bacterium]